MQCAAETSNFVIQTVDSTGNVGLYNSLALGSDGNPHIAYEDHTTGRVKYAHWTGSSWLIRTVTDTMPGGTWLSLALDSSSMPHMSYFGTMGGDLGLKYAEWTGSSWQVQTVDTNIGYYSSLALDSSGNPHISYLGYSNGSLILRYARFNGSAWQTETIEGEPGIVQVYGNYTGGHAEVLTGGRYSSLVLDSSDNPHITYGNDTALRYAEWTGTKWEIQTVETCCCDETSLALDSHGNPHVSYRTYAHYKLDLKYAEWTGSSWEIQTVDSSSITAFISGWSSLALDSEDNPHISYYDIGSRNLKHAVLSGSTWDIQIVGSVGAFSGCNSLALGSNGNACISYYDGTNENLKYAVLTETTSPSPAQLGLLGTDDWPMFHHDPQHSGYSTSTAYNANQTPWSYVTGSAVDSSPAVVDGKVYVGSSDNNVYCLNAATGAYIWKYTTGGPVKSSPAVVNGKVYICSDDSKLYCLSAEDGTFIWSYTTGAGMRYSSPVVVNGRAYVGAGDNKMYCLDAEQGTQLWNYTTNSSSNVYSSPAVAGDRVYVGTKRSSTSSFGGWVSCLNAVTGESIWNSSYDTLNEGYTSSPAVADGRVYICSLQYTLGPEVGKILCLDAMTGTDIWSNFPYHPGGYGGVSRIYSSPAVAEGKVYVGSTYNSGGVVTCYDALTGTELWHFLTGAAVESSPAVADGKVYVGSNDGRVYCLNAQTGDFIWNEIANAGYSSPAVVDGIIYIGSNGGKVRCLNPAVGGWDFDDLFKLNDLRIIYPSAETLKPLGCTAAMVSDWTASAFISTKLENATEGLDTDSGFVNQATGKPTGVAGTGVVSFGGPIVNLVVAYAENASTRTGDKAPVRFHQESGTCYFQYSNGTSITGANLLSSVINSNADMFVIEAYRDGDGRYMLLCYGFGWKGTYAAGKYFDAEIYPNIALCNYTWRIVKWDDTNANGFVNTAADGDTYTIIATG